MSTPGEMLEALGREARARFGNGRDATTRVYRGRSVDELVPQIQRDLGADAIIVRRREGLTGGVLGFFQRAFVEIEAMPGGPGVDLYDEPASPPPPAPAPQAVPMPPQAAPAGESAPTLEGRPAVGYPPAASQSPGVSPQQAGAPSQFASAPPPPRRPSYAPPAPAAGQPPSPQYQPYELPRPAPQRPPFAPSAPAAHAPPSAPPLSSVPAPSSAPPLSSAPLVSPTPPVSAPPPTPFYTREPSAPPAGAGSAYVTAHLAALARADRSKVPPRASIPVPREEPPAWGADFQELIPSEAPQAFAPEPAPPRARPAAPRRADSERRMVAPGSHARAGAGVARSLRRCGIGEELARELIDGAGAHALALAPRAGLAQAVRATLAQRIPVAPPLPTKGAAIVIVGAGGAGKTTCCAALLGAYRKSSSLPASFATITSDPTSSGTGKGERDELRMILSPYVMKPTPARAPRALRAVRRARGDGMAVIDTPSLSPSDRAGIRELAALLAELEPERVVVALPATLGATAAAQLLQALKPLGANALAVTHADETDQIGVAVEAACRFGLAPEYMLERARAGGWRVRQIGPTALAERLLP
ncbi:MAG TPA: hypothetical protein VK778_10170 [Solirubrobacteraceae bacterium]|nr:hypothetical protein [Solirubrobacteraceae bacterium]